MSSLRDIHLALRLERAVNALCPYVARRHERRTSTPRSEAAMRRELVGCILGSQVRNEMAIRFTRRLVGAGLLQTKWWSRQKSPSFERRLVAELGNSGNTSNCSKYRFPRSRSRQLAVIRDTLAQRSLQSRVDAHSDPRELRRRLVCLFPGVGPKQASMFLRNVGATLELAVLDVHVLRFLAIQGLLPDRTTFCATLRSYERVESIFADYSRQLGFQPGLVDVAVWATMKAAERVIQ